MTGRPVLILTCAIGVIGANSLALSPISRTIAADLPGISAEDVMIGSAAYGVGTAISALVLAPLADRFGAGRSLILALMALTMALALSALAPDLPVLLAAQALAGLAAGAALPAIYTLAARVAPAGAEGRVMGQVLTGWTLSLIFGVTLSAVLTEILHWRAVFGLISGVSAVLAALLLSMRLPQSAGAVTSPLTALRVPGAGRGLVVVAALMLSFYGPYTYLGPFLTGAMGLSASQATLPVLGYGIGFGLAARLDRLIDHRPYGQLAPIVFASVAACLLGMAAAASSLSLIAFVLVGLGWGVANHLALNLAIGRLNALDPNQRGAIMGLNSAVTYGCVFAAASGFRPVVEIWGFAWVPVIAAGLIGLAVLETARRPTAPSGV